MADAIPVTGRASIPSEANKKGGLNETTPPEQRKPTSDAPVSENPLLGDNGEYLPATYNVIHTSAVAEGRPPRDIVLVRTDR